MAADLPFLNRAFAFGSALVYWSGVWLQARRVRRWIGRSPNVKPQGRMEKLLWAGWFVVVGLWLTIPFIAGKEAFGLWAAICSPLIHPAATAAGIALMVAGYAATLWSYSAMGRNWRMGIKQGEQTMLVTRGPFQFVRHPIYFFQIVMLVGLALLLPTLVSLIAMVIHLFCVLAKTADEESFLLAVHGADYQDYQSCTGKLLPKYPRRKSEPGKDGATRPKCD